MTARRIAVGFATQAADSPFVRRLVPFVLIVLVACGDDGGGDAAPTTRQAIEITTTTTTTTEPPSTTTCPRRGGGDLVSTFDIDGDGVDEVWRAAGSGASVEIVELRRVVDCVEVPMLLDGVLAQFPIGGSVTHLDGVRCEDDVLVHVNALSDDAATYATTERRYELDDTDLVLVDETTGSITTADAAFPDIARFAC